MDTPDNSKNRPSPSFLSKFEDSPVFNYISTLSPIKQFSLRHDAQSFHLLSFASPHSLQTPPVANCPKESEIKSGNHASDASMNNSSQNGCEGRSADTTDAVQPCDLHIEDKNKFDSGSEAYVITNDEPSNLADNLSSVRGECANSASNAEPSGAVKPDCKFNVVGSETCPGNLSENNLKEAGCLTESHIDMQGIEVEPNKEVCEWERFICDASDILNCHSPTKTTQYEEQHDKTVDSETLSFVTEVLQTPNENMDGSEKIEALCPPNSSEKNGEAGTSNETSQMSSLTARGILAEEVVHCVKTEIDDKFSTQQQQTTSRRCLVYEMSGSHYRKLLSDSTGGSPISKSAASANTSREQYLVSKKPGSSKFSSLLPGIGLHLNALAATGREKIIVKRQNLTCRRQLLSVPSTMSSFKSLNRDIESLNTPLTSGIAETVCEVQKDDTLNESACEESASGEGSGLPQDSPKKKRKKPETIGETDSCKRCNCKRSKCLKLYCECFAAGLYCVEPCNCQNCFNKPAHEDTVLETRRQIESRNPLAFAPKVVVCSGTPNNVHQLKTPASARHKRGCNCKKSGCLKKYCECFQGGVGCSLSCRCEGCKNTFGRKEGIEGLLFEEAKILKECASDVSLHDEISKTDHEIQAAPEPSKNERQLVRRPFQFGGVIQELPLLPCGQSLQSCTSQKTDDSDQTSMVEEHNIVPNDEAMEDLKGDYLLPTTTVKSTSPNCKRISSHQHDFETSPGWKSCRKLILRSIPSLSTVMNEKESTGLHGKLQ